MLSLFRSLVVALRDGAWLDADRARAYVRILFAISALVSIAWIGSSDALPARRDPPIGADFVSFWAASQLALAGHPGMAWNIPAHWAAERPLIGAPLGYAAFFYPPPYLLVCLPLALAPYFWSLGFWLAATGYAYWRVVRRILPGLEPMAFLAFPAVLLNAAHGQNAFLTGALFGAGLFSMNRRPVLAGVLLGLLIFKPQLALLLPFSLLCARRWVAFAAAAFSALAACALSWAVFGTIAWANFLAEAPFARMALERNLIGDHKMQSLFAAVRLVGGPLELAYGLQGIGALAAIAAVCLLHRRAFRSPAEPAAVVCACLLASPFLLDYDLALLAIPLAWLTGEGLRSGFRAYEKTIALGGYLTPLIARTVAGSLGLPLAPAIIAAIFLCVMRRGLTCESALAPRFRLDRESASDSDMRAAAEPL